MMPRAAVSQYHAQHEAIFAAQDAGAAAADEAAVPGNMRPAQ